MKERRVKAVVVMVVEKAHHKTAHHKTVQGEAKDLKDVARVPDKDQWDLRIQNGWLNTPCTLMQTATANLINQR